MPAPANCMKSTSPPSAAILAGAGAVMPSYGAVDGMPNHASAALLTAILREAWGFRGVVISDGGGLPMLAEHRVANDSTAARALAITAGVDLELSWQPAGDDYAAAVARGLLSEHVLDRAVGRILALKFRLGLFEHPFIAEDLARKTVFCGAHRALALAVARESMVLLKNTQHLLPLSKNLRGIAVIGANADAPYNQLGDYTGIQRREDVGDGARRHPRHTPAGNHHTLCKRLRYHRLRHGRI